MFQLANAWYGNTASPRFGYSNIEGLITTSFKYKTYFADPIEQNLPAKEEMRDFDSVIVNFMREQGIPGASLCIAKGGHVIYTQSKCYFVYHSS